MINLYITFSALALFSGLGLLFAGTYTASRERISKMGVLFCAVLFIVLIVSTFLAISFNYKSCSDYTVSDYEAGDVPISCATYKTKT